MSVKSFFKVIKKELDGYHALREAIIYPEYRDRRSADNQETDK